MSTTAHDPVAQPPRETKQWWAVTGDCDNVRLVTGYDCGPNNPGYWWCPEVGASMSEDHHLFTTEAKALDKLIAELETRLANTTTKLAKLRLRRTML